MARPLEKLDYLPWASLGESKPFAITQAKLGREKVLLTHREGDGIWKKNFLAKFCFHWTLSGGAPFINTLILLASYPAPFCLIGKLHTNPKE